MPQQATSIGLKYNSQNIGTLELIIIALQTSIYLQPDRRTTEALAGYAEGYPYVNEIIDQTN